MTRTFSLVAFLLFSFCSSLSQPTQPILRIEAGMHTAVIRRIGVDDAERFIVTGSDDKTVRVWDLATGRLLQILRVPLGNGSEGKIYSVAVSPDGATIAAGGWTGYEWDKSHSIHIIDRSSGKITKRITGLPSTINHLTFSPDGKFLAATLGANGLRVFSTSDYALLYEDTEYGEASYGAVFDIHSQLATVCYDGYVRMYEYRQSRFAMTAKLKTNGGRSANSVAFSPDGRSIAVGFYGSKNVDVYSVTTDNELEYDFSPSTQGLDHDEYFCSVAWSSDGRFLYAGGSHAAVVDNRWKRAVRKWSSAGRGAYKDIYVSEDGIFHILPLKSGGVVYCAADPQFGIIDASDRLILEKTPVIGDFRFDKSTFRMSYDATKIFFSYDNKAKPLALFSITDKELRIQNAATSSLTPPKTASSLFQVTDWENEYEPKFNGKKLVLRQYEASRSLAIAPSDNGFLLGADWDLRYYSAEGEMKWNVDVPGSAWQVNIAPNGRVAAVAFGDGTIRWYRISDGKELLAFFPHNDQKRWVIWTPSGYYDASPGGEDLIGWHINNGKEQAADFYSASRFRATYYRPDVVSKILETLDEGEALRLANEESNRKQQTLVVNTILPPVIQIAAPISGSEVSTTNVKIQYSIRSQSGEPVTGVRALVNGRPVATKRGMRIVERESNDELQVTIPESDCEVSLIAENKNGSSEPSMIFLKWKGKKEEFVVKPKMYVLAVGISDYNDHNLTLGLSAKDAQDISIVFLKQKGLLYRDVLLKTLIDQNATRGDIIDGLEWLQKETTSKDVAVIYFSGHGMNDPSGIFYYLPVDVDVERLKRTAIPYSEFTNTVSSIAGKVLVFADACHSGNIVGMRKGTVDISAVVNELASAENGAVVFSSSLGRQYSLEKPEWGNGAFTKALVEGLSGQAAYNKGNIVTVKMLDLYVTERVKELTGGNQAPVTVFPPNVPDFPIAITK